MINKGSVMNCFFGKRGNITMTIVGTLSAIALFLLVGNNIAEKRVNELNEIENEVVYTTTTRQPEVELVDKVALPDVIYTSIQEPLVIRFMNIIGCNSLENYSVEVNTDGKGKLYDDRWEYTPQTTETFSLSFTVTDPEGEKVNESSHTIVVRKPNQKKNFAVLVIGDSTIAGGYETKRMLDLANESGKKFTLLGTKTTSYVNDENNRHEGRSGWKAITYIEKAGSSNSGDVNAFFNPETETFDYSYYMRTQGYTSVDCVCLQLGINDVFGASSDEQLYSDSYINKYFKNMDKIIESIHAYDSNIKIVWNLILPGSVEQEKFELAYKDKQTAERYKRNTYLTNLEIIKHVSEMKNVYVAPTNASLNTVENMYMGGNGAVHPARKGYFEVGALLYSYILAIDTIE